MISKFEPISVQIQTHILSTSVPISKIDHELSLLSYSFNEMMRGPSSWVRTKGRRNPEGQEKRLLNDQCM